MWPNPQFPAGFFTFTEEIFNGKLPFLRKFLKFLLTAVFQNIVMALLLQWLTACKKKKLGTKKVLERSSFDNFFPSFCLQVALSQSAVETNLTLKSWSMSNLKVLFLLYHRVQNAEMRAFSDPYFPAYGQNRRPENTN